MLSIHKTLSGKNRKAKGMKTVSELCFCFEIKVTNTSRKVYIFHGWIGNNSLDLITDTSAFFSF